VLNIAIGSEYNKDIDTELRPHRETANVLGQEQFPDNTGLIASYGALPQPRLKTFP